MHQGKFKWLFIPIGLIHRLTYFLFIVKSILKRELGSCLLPMVMYLDDIVVYGDTQEQIVDELLKSNKCLAPAGFILNMYRSQLVQSILQVSQYQLTSSGFWVPNITKFGSLMEKMDCELARMNWASLYRLLNYYREYAPASTKLVKPISLILSQDA